MRSTRMSPFMLKGKGMLLAYDQGLEHGPSKDFNQKSVDPEYILDIASKGKFTGIIFQKGVAEKYYDGKVPLIIKVNGKTSLPKGEPIASQICSVKQAKALGARAVKIKYTGDSENFKWAVKSAGAAKVFMSGGPKAPTDEAFLTQVKGAIDAGATGLAVGRNVWQHERPLKMAAALREIILNGQSVETALKELTR